MKRYIQAVVQQDEFDKQWEEKFGPDDESLMFHSFEEFRKWFEEVKQFEPVHNQ